MTGQAGIDHALHDRAALLRADPNARAGAAPDLRPRSFSLRVPTEEFERVKAANQDEPEQFARNVIANYPIVQPVRINADLPSN
jgi:hypothetical protein